MVFVRGLICCLLVCTFVHAQTVEQATPINEHWWMQAVNAPLAGGPGPCQVTLEGMVFSALQQSKRIAVARIDGFVEVEKISEQDANFDWIAFADSLFRNTNQATGSAIEAGDGVDRLIQQEFSKNFGAKRKNRIGGQFEVTQDLKLLQNNSILTDPNDQAFSQVALRYTQPLLRDGGKLVNYGQVILARLNANATLRDSDAAIAAILEEVTQAYWDVYRLRSRYIVQHRLVDRIEGLAKDLKSRSRIDAKQSLLGQAESELATQQSTLAATRVQLKQAELKLIRVVGDRSLSHCSEIIPISPVPAFQWEVDPLSAFPVAMQNRPEIRAAFERINSSDLSKKIAYRQLLPKLAMILETNATGVNGDFQLGRSIGDQFSEGGPGYAVGLNYEIPLGNRGAKSRARQAELLMSREIANLEDVVDQVRLEVEESVVGLEGAANQYQIRDESIRKSEQVANALMERRKIFPESIDQVSQLYVREILDAQQRTTAAELALIDLLFDYSVTTIKLRKATGTLLSRYSTPTTAVGPSSSGCFLDGSHPTRRGRRAGSNLNPYSRSDIQVTPQTHAVGPPAFAQTPTQVQPQRPPAFAQMPSRIQAESHTIRPPVFAQMYPQVQRQARAQVTQQANVSMQSDYPAVGLMNPGVSTSHNSLAGHVEAVRSLAQENHKAGSGAPLTLMSQTEVPITGASMPNFVSPTAVLQPAPPKLKRLPSPK